MRVDMTTLISRTPARPRRARGGRRRVLRHDPRSERRALEARAGR